MVELDKGNQDEKEEGSKKRSRALADSAKSGRKRKLYFESIPEQVSLSMAFEGEYVSLKMLKEYLRTLKNTPQPHGT